MISFGYARVSTPGPGFERTGRGVAKLRLVPSDDTPLMLDPKFFVRANGMRNFCLLRKFPPEPHPRARRCVRADHLHAPQAAPSAV